MTYDDFFVEGDKPYAENLNDSVLLSNVLEFGVKVVVPDGFSNKMFVDTISRRKCGVCTIRLDEQLPQTVSVTSEGYLNFSEEGSVDFYVYPNFNQFGEWKKLSWISDEGNISVDLLTKNKDIIVSNVSNDSILSSNSELKKLDEIIVRVKSSGSDILTQLCFEFNKKVTSFVDNESVRFVGYSTTDEMNTAIAAATVNKADIDEVYDKSVVDDLLSDKVNLSDVEDIIHNVLREVFDGKVGQVTIEDGRLKVSNYEEGDL